MMDFPIEYSPYYDDESGVARSRKISFYHVSVETWEFEAARRATEIAGRGHKSVRIVIDGEWCYALTCDDCMLWANVTRRVSRWKESYDSSGGDLLEVLECDPEELHRRFGKSITADDAWAGYSSWTVEPWFDAKIALPNAQSDAARKTGSGGWKKLRSVYREKST